MSISSFPYNPGEHSPSFLLENVDVGRARFVTINEYMVTFCEPTTCDTFEVRVTILNRPDLVFWCDKLHLHTRPHLRFLSRLPKWYCGVLAGGVAAS